MTDYVNIWHPITGTRSRVTRAAFERRSRRLGWEIAEDPSPEAHQAQVVSEASGAAFDATVTTTTVDERTRLQQLLAGRGIDFDRRLGVKKLRELAEQTDPEAAE